MGALAALLLMAGCSGPASGPADPSTPEASTDGGAATGACVAPAVPPIPVGTTVDLGAGRGTDPVGLTGTVGDVAVLDLGAGDAAAFASALADALDPCADGEPVVATGPLGALVTAAALAAAEARPLVPPIVPDVVTDPAAGSATAVAATLDLMDRWGTRELLVVEEEDVAAWAALVAEASVTAAPLVLPAVPASAQEDAPDAGAPDAEAPDAGAPDVEATPEAASSDDAASDDAPATTPAAVDPAVAALARLPAEVTLTAVASDADRAAALAARLVAAGRAEPAVRVAAVAPDAPPAGWDGATGGTLWLVDPTDPVRLLVAAAAAGARDESLLAVDPRDVTALLRRGTAIRTVAPARVLLAGGPEVVGASATTGAGGAASAATVAWALDVALHTDPLPWGGWLPLDGTRIVALYGTPGAPSLGALGQQDLDATIDRVRETAARYDLDGLRIVPGFDLITTVASAAPGPAGDYSQRVSIERLRPLIDRAGAEGMAVFIDLQPGRTDFLVQAQEYEELLLEPHVFLALDPEWRLRPDQVHLRQIGSVEAAEVQRVADWLAELVRRERLPQKAFMLHQFLLEMLPDRDTVVVPPELVGVVHVDGQGPIATKERTFRIMAEGADPQWRWGWKQFLRIDTPTIMDPADVIDRTPLPVVITYQ